MGIHRNYVNKKTHRSLYGYNIGIHRKYVSFIHTVPFFIVKNFGIWVYKRIKIHFLFVTLKLS